jgi:1,2-diacylglycerol 3-beta-glucosyltransferase
MFMILEILLSLMQLILLFGLGYYYLLLLTSIPNPEKKQPIERPTGKSFAVAIPAHNESAVIGRTVMQLQQQAYPREQYDVYVVADYCHDDTADVARQAGAICLERQAGERGRKAYALQWLLQQIVAGPKQYDAICIFDADSQVDPDFMRVMEARLAEGAVALQGQHLISNPGAALFSRLAAVDMRLNNLLRNRAKHNLGWSCRLMGDAMCLTTDLIRKHGWGGESLTEDREFEIYLLLSGERVRYAPGAISLGQATSTWGDAAKQRKRWYGGVVQVQNRFLLPLIKQFFRRGDLAVLDRSIELLLPPFSFLAMLTFMVAVGQWWLPGLDLVLPLAWTGWMAVAWILFPFAGLLIDGAPRWCYQTMLYAPFYLVWRLWQGIFVWVKRGRIEWVRTRRTEEK